MAHHGSGLGVVSYHSGQQGLAVIIRETNSLDLIVLLLPIITCIVGTRSNATSYM